MKTRYDLGNPDLSPDLQWMLESRQVSDELLLEALLQHYLSSISALTASLIPDPTTARQATVAIFARAVLSAPAYRHGEQVETWMLHLAWDEIHKTYRHRTRDKFNRLIRRPPGTRPASISDDEDALLLNSLNELSEPQRSWFILHFHHGWTIHKIGEVCRSPALTVQVQLNFAEEALEHNGRRLDELQRALKQRWLPPVLDETERLEIKRAVEERLRHKRGRVKSSIAVKEVLLLAGLVLFVIALLVWGGEIALPGEQTSPSIAERASTPTASAARRGRYRQDRYRAPSETFLMPRAYEGQSIPTPTPTLAGVFYTGPTGESLAAIAARLGVLAVELRTLNRIPADERIYRGPRLLIPGSLPKTTLHLATPVPEVTARYPTPPAGDPQQLSAWLAHPETFIYTVWLDAFLTPYAPPALDAAPQVFRVQLWFGEEQGLLLGGPEGEMPHEVLLWLPEEIYIARPGKNNPWFEGVRSSGLASTISPTLFAGVFLLLKGGLGENALELLGEGEEAGRRTWMLEVVNSNREPIAYINVDQQTGFLLSYQQIVKDPELSFFSAPEEIRVTSIEYNVDFPQELFNPRLPWRGGYAVDHSGTPFPSYWYPTQTPTPQP